MDARQFEALSRRVALLVGRVGRRPLLRAALVAPLAGCSALVDEGEARRKRKKKCKPPRIKCGKKCLAATACCSNTDCVEVTGQVCATNSCRCPSGQVVVGSECAVPCSPVCDACQRCDDGTCVDLADGAACTDGGVCRNNVCKPDRSFGCTVAQNSCGASGSVPCPDSTTNNLFCFVDVDGDPVCGSSLCTNDATGEQCADLTGAGSIVVPCAAICGAPDINKTHMCVKPVEA